MERPFFYFTLCCPCGNQFLVNETLAQKHLNLCLKLMFMFLSDSNNGNLHKLDCSALYFLFVNNMLMFSSKVFGTYRWVRNAKVQRLLENSNLVGIPCFQSCYLVFIFYLFIFIYICHMYLHRQELLAFALIY
jgi:hypothetical protein